MSNQKTYYVRQSWNGGGWMVCYRNSVGAETMQCEAPTQGAAQQIADALNNVKSYHPEKSNDVNQSALRLVGLVWQCEDDDIPPAEARERIISFLWTEGWRWRP